MTGKATHMLDDLIRFLTARLNEDEAQALAWASDPDSPPALQIVVPLRLKAEVEAKRRIIAEHQSYGDYGEKCGTCYKEDDLSGDPWPCLTLRAAASVYQDHPDFQEGWRP